VWPFIIFTDGSFTFFFSIIDPRRKQQDIQQKTNHTFSNETRVAEVREISRLNQLVTVFKNFMSIQIQFPSKDSSQKISNWGKTENCSSEEFLPLQPPTPQLKPTYLPYLFLAGIWCILLVFKLLFNPYPVGDYGLDGSFYYQIARHVSEGDGLLTSVSLYHQGIKNLPQPSTIYPLWPLVLGGVGSLIGLEQAASLLPEALFLFSILLLYVLGNAIVTQQWGPEANLLVSQNGWINVGHLVALLFGLNKVFFGFTSLPYTEGLAFCLGIMALLALVQSTKRVGSPFWGILAGGLAALSYLSRSQMIGILVAILATFFLMGFHHKRYFQLAIFSMMSSILVVLPWVVYLTLGPQNFSPTLLLDFSAYRETPELQRFIWTVETHSIWEFVTDRLGGLLVAFNFTQPHSYMGSFGLSAYIPIVVLSYFLWSSCMINKLAFRSFCDPRSAGLIGASLSGLACLALVHATHLDYQGQPEWLFHFRHGLPLIFLITVAAGYLLAQKNPALKKLVLVLFILSYLTGINAVRATIQSEHQNSGPTHAEQAFSNWIDHQTTHPVFVTTRPWALGAFTSGNFHGVMCDESLQQMETYITQVRITHVVTNPADTTCGFFTTIKTRLTQVAQFEDPHQKLQIWEIQ